MFVSSNVHLAMLTIKSDLCPSDAARICKPLLEFNADVDSNSSRFLMMDNAALQPGTVTIT
jgi:hypothetical protein